MNMEYLIEKLSEVHLFLMDYGDGSYSVGSRSFANPLLFFDTTKEHNGSLIVKSINAGLFSPKQIKTALVYVEDYIRKAQDERGIERYREVIKAIEKYANDCIDVKVEMNPHLVIDDIKALEE